MFRDKDPLIFTGDLNVVGGCKNEWLRSLVAAKSGLCEVSDVNAATTCSGTTIVLVLAKKIAMLFECLALSSYFTDHRAPVAVVDGTL